MDIRIKDVDRELVARLKYQAMLASQTLREYVIELLQNAVKTKEK